MVSVQKDDSAALALVSGSFPLPIDRLLPIR